MINIIKNNFILIKKISIENKKLINQKIYRYYLQFIALSQFQFE